MDFRLLAACVVWIVASGSFGILNFALSQDKEIANFSVCNGFLLSGSVWRSFGVDWRFARPNGATALADYFGDSEQE